MWTQSLWDSIHITLATSNHLLTANYRIDLQVVYHSFFKQHLIRKISCKNISKMSAIEKVHCQVLKTSPAFDQLLNNSVINLNKIKH